MKNTNEQMLLIKMILLFYLVIFSLCFVISCNGYVDVCSVNITSPENGTIFEKGDLIEFRANITSYAKEKFKDSVPGISMVKWTSDKDGDLETQTFDPPAEDLTHFFSTDSLSVNAHEIKCIIFHEGPGRDSYDRDCSDSILININENTTDTTTTTALIDLSLFKHAQIILRTVKELVKSYEEPIEDKNPDVLSDFDHEGSFSGYDYYAEWLEPADRVTKVEHTGSISVTLSSTENAVTSAEYHREEDNQNEDNVYNFTIDFEAAGNPGIPLTNSSEFSLTFRVDGFEVCDHIEHYETIKIMNETTTITRTHSYCDENSVLEIYLSQ